MKMNWKNPNTTLIFCLLRVIPVIVITIAIVIIIVTVVVTVIVIYIVINISTAVLFSLRVGILHWFLSGTWRINGSQGPIHPTPGTALEELRTRPTMHRKHLMECSTGSSRWKILKQMNDDIIQNWRTIFLSNSSLQSGASKPDLRHLSWMSRNSNICIKRKSFWMILGSEEAPQLISPCGEHSEIWLKICRQRWQEKIWNWSTLIWQTFRNLSEKLTTKNLKF